MHWIMCPIVSTIWVTEPHMAAIFCFFQVFVLWALNQIAVQIENPFGDDANDLDAVLFQKSMNTALLMLIDPTTERTPHLMTSGDTSEDKRRTFRSSRKSTKSLMDVWETA